MPWNLGVAQPANIKTAIKGRNLIFMPAFTTRDASRSMKNGCLQGTLNRLRPFQQFLSRKPQSRPRANDQPKRVCRFDLDRRWRCRL
jgi:hypothetical protein